MFLLAGATALTGIFASCEDYLTLYPTDSITGEDFWTTSNDVNNVRAAAYYQLTQCEKNIVDWGELRSDNVTLNDPKKTEYRFLQEGVLQPIERMFSWANMYKGINLCNEVLENGQRMIDQNIDPSFTRNNWLSIKAEMISLRALYYFYLVRAYRNVPLVMKSVSTDKEALEARVEATPGHVILDTMIQQVKEAQAYANQAYGSIRDDKGRWTVTSMNALLADMSMWRACMVMGARTKAGLASDSSFLIKNKEGVTLTADQEKALSTELLLNTVKYCDAVLNRMKNEYDTRVKTQFFATEKERTQPFPLYQNAETEAFLVTDIPYREVFGEKNSFESVFELQHDANNNRNSTFSTYYYGNPDGSFRAGIMVANPALFSVATSVDPIKGYGKTDMRFLSYGLYDLGSSTFSNTTPIIKGVTKGMISADRKDMLKGTSSLYVFRNHNAMDASWPIYRLADIMLMKAEAIARLRTSYIGNNTYSAREAYLLVDQLFARNNPGVDSIDNQSTEYSIRLRQRSDVERKAWSTLTGAEQQTINEQLAQRHPGFSGATGSSALLHCIYAERQREFLGEGKRWFDLVRECEFRAHKDATKDVLNDWMNASSIVRNRLRTYWSLYNPIHSEELKVNSPKYGNKNGKLVQNEAWEIYMPKMSN